MVIYAKSNNITLCNHVDSMLNIIDSIKYIDEIMKQKLRTSSIFHDTGKSTVEFQKLLNGGQTIHYRHEILSSIIYICHTQLNGEEIDRNILFSILFHHKRSFKDPTLTLDNINNVHILYDELYDFLKKYTKVKYTKDKLRKCIERKIREGTFDVLGEIFTSKKTILDEIRDYLHDKTTLDDLLYLGFLRQIDHLSSAGFNSVNYIDNRVTELFNTKFTFRKHQKEMSECDDDFVVLEANTGSGKTEAALLYSERHNSGQRIIYVINNKASLNSLYERLTQVYGKDKVSLLHSTSIIQLIDELNEGGDVNSLKTLMKSMRNQIKLTTFAQLLKIPYETKYLPELLSELYRSTVIFDEVQMLTDKETYDHFILLLKILRQLGSRIVIMSATIPDKLIEDIKKNVTSNIRHVKCIEECGGNKEYHKLRLINKDIKDIEIKVENGKVFIDDIEVEKPLLVVTNKIKTARDVYEKINTKNKLLLHSKFKMIDRTKKEKELMENYNNYDVIVTTQVVEVSVDIDTRTLLTEISPIPSLVQRFGRVNRRGNKLSTVFVTTRSDYSHVYRKNEIETSLIILRNYDGKILTKVDEHKIVKDYYKILGYDIKLNNIKFDVSNYHNLDVKENDRMYFETFDSINTVLFDDFENYKDNIIELLKRSIQIQKYELKTDKYIVVERYKNLVIIDSEYDEELGLGTIKDRIM